MRSRESTCNWYYNILKENIENIYALILWDSVKMGLEPIWSQGKSWSFDLELELIIPLRTSMWRKYYKSPRTFFVFSLLSYLKILNLESLVIEQNFLKLIKYIPSPLRIFIVVCSQSLKDVYLEQNFLLRCPISLFTLFLQSEINFLILKRIGFFHPLRIMMYI